MIGWSRIDRPSSSPSAFCRNFPMNLPRKSMFSEEDNLKMKKHSWNRMFVDPIYFDASRFLKKHIFKLYPRSYRPKNHIKEIELPSYKMLEAAKYESERINQFQSNNEGSPSSYCRYTTEELRIKVVQEMINAERDFVKTLIDVKETYLTECRLSRKLFCENDIHKIYGNWEQICSFQSTFLSYLESILCQEALHNTCIGECFLKFREKFYIYSYYCNNHPLAISTLQDFCKRSEYKQFFDEIRIQNNFSAISLDGFLLMPIQRICKYPLQLAELLKYTPTSHPDYNFVKDALNAMRNVTILINERKRKIENLEKLILWQHRVDGWEADDLIEESSQLIYQNDVSKVFTGLWFTDVTVFLFDRQLIFCMKDTFRPGFYIYKGRISLQYCEIIDIPDSKDIFLGVTVKYGIRIQNTQENKWLLFCCKSHKEKVEWLESFRREQEFVLLDKKNKLQMTAADKYLAQMIAEACNSGDTVVGYEGMEPFVLEGSSVTLPLARR